MRQIHASLTRSWAATAAAAVLALAVAAAPAGAAEDAAARVAQAPAPDPLSPQAQWRDAVMGGPLTPPAVTAASPLLVLVTTAADMSHPEFAGGNLTNLIDLPFNSRDGTAVAAIAGAPANGHGILGIWPGMRVAVSPLPGRSGVSCEDVALAFRRAVEAEPSVIVATYGFDAVEGRAGEACFEQFVAILEAVRRGILVVASGPMRIADGTLTGEPGTLPHVVSVGAITSERVRAEFVLPHVTTDLAAPGVGLLTAVPAALDPDQDGYGSMSGTGFAAPMVAAAAAWLIALDPSLTPDQVTMALRRSAEDVGGQGVDDYTGWGLLDVAGAIAQPRAPRDAREPNEDIRWINGAFLDRGQLPLRPDGRVLSATLDRFGDPVDVYRLRLQPRTAARVRVRVDDGDVALDAYDHRTLTVRSRRRRTAHSDRPRRRSEAVRVHNRGRLARTFYLRVTMSDRDLDANGAVYRLVAKRLRSAG